MDVSVIIIMTIIMIMIMMKTLKQVLAIDSGNIIVIGKFMPIYTEGYAVVDPGSKGAYMIQSI